ncbi:hypothetical protein CPB86DRAFT_795658 [Serendipita vermifera]|nr:hypothetical protein CPB86DRAFT_795658 [Serendipita vermifera]
MPTSNTTRTDSGIDEKVTRPRKRRKVDPDSTLVPTNGTPTPGGPSTTRQFVSHPHILSSVVESQGLQGFGNQMIRDGNSLRCLDTTHEIAPRPSNQQPSMSSVDLMNANLTTFMTASNVPLVTTRSSNTGAFETTQSPVRIFEGPTDSSTLSSDMPMVGGVSVSSYNTRSRSSRPQPPCLPTVSSMQTHANPAQIERSAGVNGGQRRVEARTRNQTHVGHRASGVRYDPFRSTMQQTQTGISHLDPTVPISRTNRLARQSQPLARTAALPPQNLLHLPRYGHLFVSNNPHFQSAVPDILEPLNPQIGISRTNSSSSLVIEWNLLTDIQESIRRCITEWHSEALERHNELSSGSNASSQQRDKIQATINTLERRLQGPPTTFPDGIVLLLKTLLSYVREDGDQAIEELTLWLKHYVANDGKSIASACQELLKDLKKGRRFLRIVCEPPGSTASNASTGKAQANLCSPSSSTTTHHSRRPQEYILLRRRLSDETNLPRKGKKGKALGTKVLRCGWADCQTCNKDSWETRQKVWRHLSPRYLKGKQAWICPVCSGLFMTRDNLIRHFDNKHLLKSSKNSLPKEEYDVTPNTSTATPATNFFTPASYTTPSTYETPMDSAPTPGYPTSFGHHDSFAQTPRSGTKSKALPSPERDTASGHDQVSHSDQPLHVQVAPIHEASNHPSHLDGSSHLALEQLVSPAIGPSRPKPDRRETEQQSGDTFSSQTGPGNLDHVRDGPPPIHDPPFPSPHLPPSLIDHVPLYPSCPEPPQPTTLAAYHDSLPAHRPSLPNLPSMDAAQVPSTVDELASFSTTQVAGILDNVDWYELLDFTGANQEGGYNSPNWDTQFAPEDGI